VAAQGSGRFASVSGAVLVGGASQRMGLDKAGLEFRGESLAARAAGLLEGVCEDVVLVGGDPPVDAPGRRAPDPEGPRCALRGLVGALEAARGERVLVLATDLPLVTPDLLLALVAYPQADAVAPRGVDGAQPLCAIYRRDTVLPVARAHLADGRLALSALLEEIQTEWLEGDALRILDPRGAVLTNVNAPEDLAALRVG
jgi:molybdopterin-guanine dinucleotide biosynthesis protein A